MYQKRPYTVKWIMPSLITHIQMCNPCRYTISYSGNNRLIMGRFHKEIMCVYLLTQNPRFTPNKPRGASIRKNSGFERPLSPHRVSPRNGRTSGTQIERLPTIEQNRTNASDIHTTRQERPSVGQTSASRITIRRKVPELPVTAVAPTQYPNTAVLQLLQGETYEQLPV